MFVDEELIASSTEIEVEELKRRRDAGEKPLLLDVREEHEYEIANIGGTLIPLPELPKRLHELKGRRDKEIVVMCKMGARSAKAAAFLRESGFTRVRNLTGGIHAWSCRIDRNVKRY